MPEIYVHAVEGRTIEQKRSLVKDITDAVVRHFKVPAEAVMVQYHGKSEGFEGERRLLVQRPAAGLGQDRFRLKSPGPKYNMGLKRKSYSTNQVLEARWIS